MTKHFADLVIESVVPTPGEHGYVVMAHLFQITNREMQVHPSSQRGTALPQSVPPDRLPSLDNMLSFGMKRVGQKLKMRTH